MAKASAQGTEATRKPTAGTTPASAQVKLEASAGQVPKVWLAATPVLSETVPMSAVERELLPNIWL
jgi:hypothetical protein